MSTDIFYEYKDGFHDDIKYGSITLDKGIFKKYVNSYDTKIEDSVIDSLPRRLWNCSLVWEGDTNCKRFLNDLANFHKNSKLGFVESYEERFEKAHLWLLKQELVKITFRCG